MGPYIGEMGGATETEEDSALGYMEFALGPLAKTLPL